MWRPPRLEDLPKMTKKWMEHPKRRMWIVKSVFFCARELQHFSPFCKAFQQFLLVIFLKYLSWFGKIVFIIYHRWRNNCTCKNPQIDNLMWNGSNWTWQSVHEMAVTVGLLFLPWTPKCLFNPLAAASYAALTAGHQSRFGGGKSFGMRLVWTSHYALSTRWWFQDFLFSPLLTWGNDPFWLIFFNIF